MSPVKSTHVAIFGLMLAVGLAVALFPFFPRQLPVDEGDIASANVRAPRAETFESGVLTEQARDEAAEAVPNVFVFDPTVQTTKLLELGALISTINEVRENEELDDAGRRAELLGLLPRDSVDTVITLSSERWTSVRQEADRLLAETLAASIGLAGADAAQQDLVRQVDPDFFSEEADLIADLANPLVAPTLAVDEEETSVRRDVARQTVEPVQQSVAKNQLIVEEGAPINATEIEILEEVGLLTPRVEWDAAAAAMIVAALVAGALAVYVLLFAPETLTSPRRLALVALLITVPVLLAKLYFSLALPDESRRFLAYFLPLAAAPMLIATLVQARLAVVVALLQATLMTMIVVSLPTLSLVVSIEAEDAVRVLLTYGLSAVAGVFVVHRAVRANQYLLGGALVGLTALAALFSIWLLDAERRSLDAAWIVVAALVSGLGSGVITAGGFSGVASLLGVTTRVQLMELAQLNAPLMRRLQDLAPGTFHHSIIVGNLAERAADLVGADPLLVRVGCYYHDIGKSVQPAFYIENQLGGDNPHDDMEPRTSARIIAEHVRAGLELAREHRLPERVQDFIPEHHGTRLIPYFYRMASQEDPDVDASLFRYPGPKPQSRETAVVMLADSTEALVRASEDRSPERIDSLVDEVVAERLAEGELEECDLTLRDIRTIAESFKQTLRGVYHPRIAYPEPTEGERRALMDRVRPLAERIGAISPVGSSAAPRRGARPNGGSRKRGRRSS